MKPKTVILLAAVLLIAGAAAAVTVDVRIDERLGGTVEYLSLQKNVTGVQTFVVQWYNSESVSCTSRVEFRIYNQSTGEHVGTAWAEEKSMLSGVSESFTAHWKPPSPGVYDAVLRIHHCFDIIEEPVGNFTVHPVPVENALTVAAENQPNGAVAVTVSADKLVENVVVVPVSTPAGWIIESAEIPRLQPGEERTVHISYTPSVWSQQTAQFQAVSQDGAATSPAEAVVLKREKSFQQRYTIPLLVAAILVLTTTILYIATKK